MKNFKLSACALALLVVTCAPVMAESVDLAVKGTIIPAACVPSITGEIDYGNVTAAQLDENEYTVLEKKEVDFAIDCGGMVKVAIKAINGKPGTVAGGGPQMVDTSQSAPVELLGMGRPLSVGLGVDGNSHIGGYAIGLVVSSLTADSESMTVKHSPDSGRTWITSVADIYNLYMSVSDTSAAIHSWNLEGVSGPAAIKNLTGKLAVQAYLNKSSVLKVDKAIQLNGLTTIELVYL